MRGGRGLGFRVNFVWFWKGFRLGVAYDWFFFCEDCFM